MKKHSSGWDPWYMSPEAEKKAQELRSKWGSSNIPKGSKFINTSLNKVGQEYVKQKEQEIHDAIKISAMATERIKENARYLGDPRGKEKSVMGQVVSLEEYVEDLKEFRIIKEVYVLSDEREEDGTVSILIKLIPLRSIQQTAFDKENEHITAYLDSTSIKEAEEVHVSFQYTEVYK